MLPNATLNRMDDYELSVHEAAHAALTFAAGDEVVSIRLADDGTGALRRRFERTKCPDPWSERAINLIAIYLSGAAGVARLHGRDVATLKTRSDFVRVRAATDFDDALAYARVICTLDETKVDAMFTWALRVADDVLSRHWSAVTTLADCLVEAREISGLRAFTILAAAPTGCELLGIEETLATSRRDSRAPRSMPLWGDGAAAARAPRVVPPWTVAQRGGQLVEVDERGITRRIITRPARISVSHR